MAQTFTDWELIIADDGSDLETRQYLQSLAKQPRVRVLWLAHTGRPSVVRNAALLGAVGEYVAFLDSDDLWAARKLERQLETLRLRPTCRWSYTAFLRVDAGGIPLPEESGAALGALRGRNFRAGGDRPRLDAGPSASASSTLPTVRWPTCLCTSSAT